MGRPIYPHELSDPDFSWLLNSYRENNPDCVVIESACLPVVIVKGAAEPALETDPEIVPPPAELTDTEGEAERKQ